MPKQTNNTPNETSDENLLDIIRLAGRYSLSVRSAERMLKDGKLPEPIRIGRHRRWRASDIDEHIRSLGQG